jgi:hypothetical protein
MTERRHRITTGLALVLLLSAAPLPAGVTIDLAGEDAPFIHGTTAEEQFGYSLATGDLDGDGADELIVGAPGLAGASGSAHTGGVYIFRADDVGALTGGVAAPQFAARTLAGTAGLGRFGTAIAAGDFDGDGIDDLAVGAPGTGDGHELSSGEVLVYFGGARLPGGGGTEPDVVITGERPGARLGTFLLAADLNADGAAELLVSAPGGGGMGQSGSISVLEGGTLRSLEGSVPASQAAAATLRGERADDTLAGVAVADTDGDGVLELILGAYRADGDDSRPADAGRLYVVPVPESFEQLSSPVAAHARAVVTGTAERGFLGRSMAAGDMDFDGADELVVSTFGSRAGGDKLEATGEAFILFGGPEGLGDRPSLEDEGVPRFRGATRSDMFGLPVLLADLNRDGAADVVTASQQADGPNDKRKACGEVYVYWGSLRSVMAAKAGTAELADVTVTGATERDAIGAALLVTATRKSEAPVLMIGAPDAPWEDEEGGVVPRSGKLIVLPGELLSR